MSGIPFPGAVFTTAPFPAGLFCSISRRQVALSYGTWLVILRGHIFLIFKYFRMSGNAMTASSPRAAAVAAMVTAVMYPSVRIACLLFFS
jgi:hypothetical protein